MWDPQFKYFKEWDAWERRRMLKCGPPIDQNTETQGSIANLGH